MPVASPTFLHPLETRPLRPALVLWSGHLGGAETFMVDLARAMQALGAEPGVVFLLEGAPLADRLDCLGIPHLALGLPRGRAVLRNPRRLARAVSSLGPDAAILADHGFLAAALRSGGYGAPIIGIEHGSLLQFDKLGPIKRLIRTTDRLSGATACSVVVAVSDYMGDRVTRLRPRRRVVCIPNGVDLERFSPLENGATPRRRDGEIVIGCGSRLFEGKGVEDVIEALNHSPLGQARLRIAGDGPRAQALQAQARSLAIDTRVEFLGALLDMPTFWRSTDLAVVPSTGLVESFGMAAVEAMACGKPVVASENGALPSIVVDGETGRIVLPGDIASLASAIGEYAQDPARRARHGSNGRRRCEERFAIDRAAAQYLELCGELVREAAETK
jgi:glycosyltransferase involved in cell wall biosynthesis